MTEHLYPLRVQIDDTDYAGVVYHANYLKFFERARSEMAEEIGCGIAWQKAQGIYFPVCSARLDFIKPAKLGERIEVVTHLHTIRKASLIYDQHLRLSDTPDTILCRAEVKLACVNQDFRPQGLPTTFFTMITGE